MNFNFGNTPAVSNQGANSQLAANTIHTVKFDGVEAVTITKKDGSATFDVLKIKFSNESGKFEHTIFEPKPEDAVRKENNYGYENPSNLEEMMFLLRHLIAAVAPKVNEQIEKKGGIAVESWEKLRNFMVVNTVKAIGTETQIKLLADKEGRPRFPGFVLGMSKKNETYARTNFIGAKLTFTANELKKIETAAAATPTPMSSDNSADVDVTVDDELDLDLDLA